jgi:hypothetical protein
MFSGGARRARPAALSGEQKALEEAYCEWAATWDHALALGGFGDLLRDALNAAWPKS